MKKRLIIMLSVFCTAILIMPPIAGAAPNRPTVLITQFNTEPAPLVPGNEFILEMELHNVGNRNAKKVMLTINSAGSQDSLQEMAEQETAIFSPVESSNILYVDEIKSGKTENISIKMIVPGDMKPGVYNLDISLAYGDSGTASYKEIQTIGLIISEDQPLRMISLKYPSKIQIGDTDEISVEIVNLGNAALRGVNAELEGNITAQEKSIYFGTFEPGDSDTFAVEFKPEKPGMAEVKIIVTYFDSFKQHKTISREISINVEGEALTQEDEEVKGGFWASIKQFFKMLLGLGGK